MLQKPIKFFIIAGESSGDMIGAKLIKEIKTFFNKDDPLYFIGIGGENMKDQGLNSIFNMNDINLMGFFEIIPHIPKLLLRINQTVKQIIKEKPDYLITIDSPDFCFRVMKLLQKKVNKNPKLKENFTNLKKSHIIAPSVWAYREKRAQKISKFYNLLLAILPFEPPYFEKYGLKTVFIGNPAVEKIPNYSKKSELKLKFRSKYQLKKNDFVILVTPGSRISEVKKIFPEFIKSLNLLYQENCNIMAAILVTNKTKELVTKMSNKINCPHDIITDQDKESALFSADFAIAKSGTNNLELSLYKIPMIIGYKVNYLSYLIARSFIKVKFVNLINLVLNRRVIVELIQDQCNGEKLFEELRHLMIDKNEVEKQIRDCELALEILGTNRAQSASKKAAMQILGS